MQADGWQRTERELLLAMIADQIALSRILLALAAELGEPAAGLRAQLDQVEAALGRVSK